MAFDNSLFEYNTHYYLLAKNFWLPGTLVPGGFFTCSKRAVDAALDVDLDDSDILIATYPKTGQTSTMTMIRFILHAEELEKGGVLSLMDFYEKMPFMETEDGNGVTGAERFRNLESPRFMKTHLNYEMWKKQLEKHPDLKVIQTLRNPKDALVSFYHHLRSDGQLGAFNGTWDQFFELFKIKMLPWGDFFEENADWYKFNKQRENSLVLTYEQMKRDHRDHVVKIANFIGKDLSDKAVDLIVEKSTVKNVSPKFKTRFENFPKWNLDRANFVRKGEVGDWINYFSKEQSDYIDKECTKYLEPLGIKFEYALPMGCHFLTI